MRPPISRRRHHEPSLEHPFAMSLTTALGIPENKYDNIDRPVDLSSCAPVCRRGTFFCHVMAPPPLSSCSTALSGICHRPFGKRTAPGTKPLTHHCRTACADGAPGSLSPTSRGDSHRSCCSSSLTATSFVIHYRSDSFNRSLQSLQLLQFVQYAHMSPGTNGQLEVTCIIGNQLTL